MDKDISFFEFTQLAQEEQFHLVFTQGKFIEALEKERLKYVQYQLYNFFVEVIYNHKDNKIIGLNSFLNSKSY